MTEQTSVRLPQQLLNPAKRKAAAEGRPLTSLIADGLRMVVADDRKPVKAKRVLPPVSKVGGGFLLGVDLRKIRLIRRRRISTPFGGEVPQ